METKVLSYLQDPGQQIARSAQGLGRRRCDVLATDRAGFGRVRRVVSFAGDLPWRSAGRSERRCKACDQSISACCRMKASGATPIEMKDRRTI